MINLIKALITPAILSFAVTASAQLTESQRLSVTPPIEKTTAYADETEGYWWGYYKDNFESGSLRSLGMGSNFDLPFQYNGCIKLPVNKEEFRNKVIKAIKFAFVHTDYIDDVSVWISGKLPDRPQDADICYLPVDKNDIKSLSTDKTATEVRFPEPYTIYNEDVYIGYSFKVTSFDQDLCTYPILSSGNLTDTCGLYLNNGFGWTDFSGSEYGNLAINLLLDENRNIIIGDANYDKKLNVADVSFTIDYILNGKSQAFNFKAADVNGDGEINIVDVESIIDLILEHYQAPANNIATGPEDAVITEKNNDGLGVSVIGNNSYRGCQMDVVLPKGRRISSVVADNSISATHNTKFSKLSDGRYRIVIHSINGNCIADDGEKLIDICADTNDIKIENIIFVTSELQEKHFDSVEGSTAGIDGLKAGIDNGDIYDIYGNRIKNPSKGIYVINGKKIIIK